MDFVRAIELRVKAYQAKAALAATKGEVATLGTASKAASVEGAQIGTALVGTGAKAKPAVAALSAEAVVLQGRLRGVSGAAADVGAKSFAAGGGARMLWQQLTQVGQQGAIADDAVGVITVPRNGGYAAITCNGATASPNAEFSGKVYLDAGSTLQIIKDTGLAGLSANLNVVTTDVAGTTGTDGFVTVAVQAGVLKIENRAGASKTFQVTFS